MCTCMCQSGDHSPAQLTIGARALEHPLSVLGSRPLAQRGGEEHGARGATAEISPLQKIFIDVPQKWAGGAHAPFVLAQGRVAIASNANFFGRTFQVGPPKVF